MLGTEGLEIERYTHTRRFEIIRERTYFPFSSQEKKKKAGQTAFKKRTVVACRYDSAAGEWCGNHPTLRVVLDGAANLAEKDRHKLSGSTDADPSSKFCA